MTKTAEELESQGCPHEAPLGTVNFRKARPMIVGDDEPSSPFPIVLEGPVQKGFGRGGKDLGCPTANLPYESLHTMSSVTTTGIYFGYAQVLHSEEGKSDLSQDDFKVWPMVMSLGWNPFYKNERLSAEVHIMHDFQSDFYGLPMKVIVLGYIRPELDYVSREALIADIETDKQVALNSLARPGYTVYASGDHFAEQANGVNGIDGKL